MCQFILEPCGYYDAQVRQAVVDAGYLVQRGWQVPPVENTFSSWGADGAYQRVMYSYDTWAWGWYYGTAAQLQEANSSFDTAYASGGIYHLVDHPWTGLWWAGSNLNLHVNYISNRLDVWYPSFGELYLYHFVHERGMVSVFPVGGAPSPTVTLPASPTAAVTSGPTATPTATMTPTPGFTSTPTLNPTATAVPSGNFSLWNDTVIPVITAVNEPTPVELGVKFRSDVDGYITGIRFYKGVTNTGIHTGHLWTNTGVLLAQATFTNETASGWQQVSFDVPVAITANTVYVASYFAPSGNFAMNRPGFVSGFYNAPLYAFASSEVSVGNGVYTYTPNSFPDGSYEASNYWVDVVFTISTSQPTATSTPTSAPLPTSTPTLAATSFPLQLQPCPLRRHPHQPLPWLPPCCQHQHQRLHRLLPRLPTFTPTLVPTATASPDVGRRILSISKRD